MKTAEEEREEQKRIERLHIMYKLWNIASSYGELYELLKVQGHDRMLPEIEDLHQKALDLAEEYEQFYNELYKKEGK